MVHDLINTIEVSAVLVEEFLDISKNTFRS